MLPPISQKVFASGSIQACSGKLADSDAEATETQVWLDFAHGCGYLSLESKRRLLSSYEELGKMVGSMMRKPDKFIPR